MTQQNIRKSLDIVKNASVYQNKTVTTSRGLGDTVSKITQATGVKQVIQKISKLTGKDCGCDKRTAALNRAVPY